MRQFEFQPFTKIQLVINARVIFRIPIPGYEMGIYNGAVRGSLVVASLSASSAGGAVGPQLPRVLFLKWFGLFKSLLHSPFANCATKLQYGVW